MPRDEDGKVIDGEEADEFGPDLFDEGDDETDDEEQERRHNFLILFFLFTYDETQERIRQLTDLLAEGEITTKRWAEEFRKELTARHAEAASIGRRLAGDMAPFTAVDQKAGVEAWARQEEFFRKFVEDVENDRYTVTNPDGESEEGQLNEKAFQARAKQYGAAIRGTAHEAFRVEMGDDVLRWRLGNKDHCRQQPDFPFNCPALSKEDPKPASEWPTSPAFGDTPCRGNCDCHFASVDGKYSTEGLY